MAIQRIEISNLRGIREGAVDNLSNLSILVGPNNSGKSTVLEAIWLASNAANANLVCHNFLRRGGPALHALAHTFFRNAGSAKVIATSDKTSVSATIERPVVRDIDHAREAQRQGLQEPLSEVRVRWSQQQEGTSTEGESLCHVDNLWRISKTFISTGKMSFPWDSLFVDIGVVGGTTSLEDAYSFLEQSRKVGLVVRGLKRAMSTLTDLRIIKAGDNFVLHAICGDDPPIPAYLAGDGFKRYLTIAAAIYRVGEGSIVLLEEPESFQHPRYLGELSTLIRDAAARGVQVILSTHSLELIDLLLSQEGASILPTVHRLRLHENVLHAVAVSGENARFAREELAQDLRA